jgi:hypothetical protein
MDSEFVMMMMMEMVMEMVMVMVRTFGREVIGESIDLDFEKNS